MSSTVKEIKEKTGYPVSSWLVLFLYYDKWKVSLYEVANLYYFSHIYFTSFDLKSLLFINIFYYGRIISTNLKVSFSNVKCNIQQLVRPPLFNTSPGSITVDRKHIQAPACERARTV